MPKPTTNPTLFDDVLQIETSKLNKWGYLKPRLEKKGRITWSTNGYETASISIKVNTCSKPYIELNYLSNDKPINYKINIVSVPSNLGKGKVWYFICPKTFKRCRKLYLIGGLFLHRETSTDGMYKTQTYSKKWRDLERVYGCYFDVDKYYKELYSKYFKTHYNGKPTKRYLKLLKEIKKSDSIDYRDIERLMVNGM